MLVKEKLISEIDSMDTPELLRIYDFISKMKSQTENRKSPNKDNSHYLKVRKAISGIKNSLSEFIVSERDERL